jgi:hypothetical protein
LLASHAIDLIVHVDGGADVIWNDAEPIADSITALGAFNVQVPVLFGKPFEVRGRIFLHDPKPFAIATLESIVRESL